MKQIALNLSCLDALVCVRIKKREDINLCMCEDNTSKKETGICPGVDVCKYGESAGSLTDHMAVSLSVVMQRGIAIAHGFLTGKEITEKMEKYVQPVFTTMSLT